MFRIPGRGQQIRKGKVRALSSTTRGYILTNRHVVENATAIRVNLADGRTIEDVALVGDDELTDLAVLKISARSLTATWGNSDELDVGDWVLAVGNPYGLDRTVTCGIVSATQRRKIAQTNCYQDFLQTDAAVNPGNSGGPLVNMFGEVVGVNTAIVGRSYQGISFAIPSEVARRSYEQIIKNGRVRAGIPGRGLSGIELQLVVKASGSIAIMAPWSRTSSRFAGRDRRDSGRGRNPGLERPRGRRPHGSGAGRGRHRDRARRQRWWSGETANENRSKSRWDTGPTRCECAVDVPRIDYSRCDGWTIPCCSPAGTRQTAIRWISRRSFAANAKNSLPRRASSWPHASLSLTPIFMQGYNPRRF